LDWWSVYKLGNGEHLFDTYTPIVQFSISRETQTLRYVGLEVPPHVVAAARLKSHNVVAALSQIRGSPQLFVISVPFYG
jgi:hypothetical protein